MTFVFDDRNVIVHQSDTDWNESMTFDSYRGVSSTYLFRVCACICCSPFVCVCGVGIGSDSNRFETVPTNSSSTQVELKERWESTQDNSIRIESNRGEVRMYRERQRRQEHQHNRRGDQQLDKEVKMGRCGT